jgi:hypothetical protein
MTEEKFQSEVDTLNRFFINSSIKIFPLKLLSLFARSVIP